MGECPVGAVQTGGTQRPALQNRNTLSVETEVFQVRERWNRWLKAHHAATLYTELKVERFVPLQPSGPW